MFEHRRLKVLALGNPDRPIHVTIAYHLTRAELLGDRLHVACHVLPAQRSGASKNGDHLGFGKGNRLID